MTSGISDGQGAEVGQVNQPWRTAVDRAGNLYVIDWMNARVQKFDGEEWTVITNGPGFGTGQIEEAYGIALARDSLHR